MATAARRRRRPTTRSPELELPDAEELARLKLSPEVSWYLVSRGIPLPDCPPAIKTPEAGEVLADAVFDPERVDRVMRSFGHLRHTKGKWAGQPLIPDPWQVAYVIAPVFGWVHRNDDGRWVRVVTELFEEVPRRNGKSTQAGGLSIYLTCADGEPGAEVIVAATGLRQAGYVFDPVKALAQASPALRPHVKALTRKIVHKASGSYMECVAAVADALHGGNIHGGIVDELHLHRDGELVEAIETGTGSREQPLIMLITTTDDGQTTTVYARKRDQVEKIAKRVITRPSTYGVIWCADEQDDPFAEPTWRKANPGAGISPSMRYLREAAEKAREDPAELPGFLRLHLGIRTGLAARYIDLDVWDRNAGLVDPVRLRGRECWGGLDLATTSDLTAFCLAFPDPDGDGYELLWRHWIPERAFRKLDERTSRQATVWRDQGLLTVTPGDVTDYSFVRRDINLDRELYDVHDIAYDRWNSSQVVIELGDDGAAMAQMGQGFATLSAPLKALKHELLAGTAEHPRLRHGGNRLMRWQATNLRVEEDAAGNVKPSKKTSMDKIDGFSAAVNALARALANEAQGRSIYEDDDLEVG